MSKGHPSKKQEGGFERGDKGLKVFAVISLQLILAASPKKLTLRSKSRISVTDYSKLAQTGEAMSL